MLLLDLKKHMVLKYQNNNCIVPDSVLRGNYPL